MPWSAPGHIRDWNAKVGSQEAPAVTGKFGLGVRNEGGQTLIEFCQENTLVIANTIFQQHILGFPSRRGLTPRGSLECNPEIPAFPGEEN